MNNRKTQKSIVSDIGNLCETIQEHLLSEIKRNINQDNIIRGYINVQSFLQKYDLTVLHENVINSSYIDDIFKAVQLNLYYLGFNCHLHMEGKAIKRIYFNTRMVTFEWKKYLIIMMMVLISLSFLSFHLNGQKTFNPLQCTLAQYFASLDHLDNLNVEHL